MKKIIFSLIIIMFLNLSFSTHEPKGQNVRMKSDISNYPKIDVIISFKDSSSLKSTLKYTLNNFKIREVKSIQFRDMKLNDTIPKELDVFVGVKNVMLLNCKNLPKLKMFNELSSLYLYNCNISIENRIETDSLKTVVIEDCKIRGLIDINKMKLLSDFRLYNSSAKCISGNLSTTFLARFEIANYTGPMLDLKKFSLTADSNLEYLVLHSNNDNLKNLPKNIVKTLANKIFIYHNRLSKNEHIQLTSIGNRGTVMFDVNTWSE